MKVWIVVSSDLGACSVWTTPTRAAADQERLRRDGTIAYVVERELNEEAPNASESE